MSKRGGHQQSNFEQRGRDRPRNALAEIRDYQLPRKLKENVSALPDDVTGVVLLSCGAFSPVHKQHFAIMDLAQRYIEQDPTQKVVAALLSPSQDAYVQRKLGKEAISSKHRLAMIDAASAEHPVLCSWSWESGFQQGMNCHQVSKHLQQALLRAGFTQLKVAFVCGADLVTRGSKDGKLGRNFTLAEQFVQDGMRMLVATREGGELAEQKQTVMSYELLTLRDDNVSSTMIRQRLSSGQRCADLTGEAVEKYLIQNGLLTLRGQELQPGSA